MRRAIITIAAVFLVLVAGVGFTQGRTITVDDDGLADFNNIQAAINDANEGDTIIVAEGRYYENINFGGKDIVLRSTDPADSSVVEKTVIDGRYLDSVVMFAGTESPACILAGFTVTRGLGHGYWYSNDSHGGGLYGNGTVATIEHNVISGNLASGDNFGDGVGGGIYDCDGIIRFNIIANNTADGDMGRAYGGGLYGCDGVIQDNVIGGNYSMGSGGGLSYCHGSIERNVVTQNEARYFGGGLFRCNGVIRDNLIAGNFAEIGGGGILCFNGEIERNMIVANQAETGGGIYAYTSGSLAVVNCTFAENEGAPVGGAIYVDDGNPTLRNCILWADVPNEIYVSSGSVTATYCNIRGGWPGTGNIDADPCFADPNSGDYHLKSRAGRWDANEARWVIDEVTSPCIDAGDPMTPIGLEPFPNGGIVNMGAYGGTAEASKSYFGEPVCETIVAGDINGDCKVNFEDFRLMALHWLEAR